MRKEDYLIFEDDFNEVPNREQYSLIRSELNDHNCKNIIIPSTLIKQMTNETQSNFIQLQGDIIISLNKTVDFNACLHFLKERFKASREFKTGISFNVLQRESIKLIDTLCEKLSLNEKEQTIIRIKKGQTIYTEDQALKPNQLIKVNTFYKWGLFTILNLIRRHKIKLIINCNNLYDISWLYIQRAQMNIEAQTFFEVNILKFPNISKISFLFCEQNIQSKSTLASSNYDHNLKIIIKKLISQANLFEGYHSSPLNTKSIFFKSHHRFFIYLKHNFLKTYLKKISIDE